MGPGARGRLRRHHKIQSCLQSQGPAGFPAWRLLGSQLGALPEPQPLGCRGLCHLCPCTPVPCLTLQPRKCPFGRGGGMPHSPPLEGPPTGSLRQLHSK